MSSESGGANPLRKRRDMSYESVPAVVLLMTPLSRISRAKLSFPRPVSPSTVSRPFLMGVLHEAVTGRARDDQCAEVTPRSSSFSSCVSMTLPEDAARRLPRTLPSAVTHRRAAVTDTIARTIVVMCPCVFGVSITPTTARVYHTSVVGRAPTHIGFLHVNYL